MARAKTSVLGAAALCLAFLSAPAFPQDASQGKEWDLVYIGNSFMTAAARLFAERASADLGVAVHMWQRNSTLVPPATEKLQSGEWSIVDNAKIVLVQMSGTFGHHAGYCLGTTSDAPYGQTPEALRAEVDAFLAELTRHVDPKTTMIRIAAWAVPAQYKALWVEGNVVDDCAAGWVALMAQWKEAAAHYGIPVIDVLAAWNGADGKGDTPAAYFDPQDRRRLTEKGNAAIAELIHALGYAPLAP